MNTSNRLIITTFLLLLSSLVVGQSIIKNSSNLGIQQKPSHFEYAILTPSKFQMNHGFTLMTSMNTGISQTTGIYSNSSNYKLSERLQFNMGLHLIQNQSNLSYSSAPQTGIKYEFGLEYKLSPNSLLTLQLTNYNNSPILSRSLSPFNVP
jgi:hypothetical protein